MKLSIALVGIIGTMAHLVVAGKCHHRQPNTPVSYPPIPSTAYSSVYHTNGIPSDWSNNPTDAPTTTSKLPDPTTTSKNPDPATTSKVPDPATTSKVPDPATTSKVPDPTTTNTKPTGNSNPPASGAFQLTMAQLDKVAPPRAGDKSCDNVQFKEECAPNSKALPAINKAMTKYGITSRGQAAAVLATMTFESVNWTYNINHYPGRPGQGCRNMQQFNFNLEYAKELHQDELAKLVPQSNSPDSLSDEIKNKVRGLVLNDDDSFAAGFWYLAKKAPAFFNKSDKLRDDNEQDFEDYISNGVHTGKDPKRTSEWVRVNAALK